MPRLTIPVTEITTEEHLPAAVVPAYVTGLAADDLALAYNDGHVVVEINSTDAAPQDAIFVVQALAYGERSVPGGPIEISDNIVTVPAGGTVMVGGLSPAVYNRSVDPSFNGTDAEAREVHINVAVNTLRFRAFHLPFVGGPQKPGT